MFPRRSMLAALLVSSGGCAMDGQVSLSPLRHSPPPCPTAVSPCEPERVVKRYSPPAVTLERPEPGEVEIQEAVDPATLPGAVPSPAPVPEPALEAPRSTGQWKPVRKVQKVRPA